MLNENQQRTRHTLKAVLKNRQVMRMQAPYPIFGLTLMVNHACNLRCSYCYTGRKFSSPMPAEVGRAAIRRGFQSLAPAGQLHLSFFGGEPLLETESIQDWMNFARDLATDSGKGIRFNLTTNGTLTHPEAWRIMMDSDMDLAISFDGTPELHDRHRRDAHGRGSAALVESTLIKLAASEKPFDVITVVRPDNLSEMSEALRWLYGSGVRQVHLSLDLWTNWTGADCLRLEKFVDEAARLWREWLPEFSLNWFDAKAAELACLPVTEMTTRCGFGNGEIAVAPSGRLYPCERLIGDDGPDQPLRLPGHALQGEDFLEIASAPFVRCSPCTGCALAFACDTNCRCSNFIRTGDQNRPDGLLCLLNKATGHATAVILNGNTFVRASNAKENRQEKCYV
jgi:uncharacterized protein